MVFNKNNKKEISAVEDLIKAKVYVNPTRFEELNNLKTDIWLPEAELPNKPCTLLCLNPSPHVEDALRALTGYALQVEHICDDPTDVAHKEDRKRFVKLFKKLEQAGVGAVVHSLGSQDEELSVLDKRVIALSLLARLPVICVATACPDPLPAASAASGDTWPVFFVPHPEDARPLCEWLSCELPRVRALSSRIESELQSRVAHLAEVNAPLHFLKRASVALVPFGVMTVNFLGILRLMATMLKCVGMRGDTSANKALGLLGAQNAALVTAVDSMGDVYSFAIFTTVLADLQGMGLVEAAAAMDVVDGLMLGSISVVTGAVSALGAYLSRPGVVRAAASFLASLQTMYVLNPDMRRPTERRAGGKGRKGKGKGKGKGGEETQCLLQMSKRVGAGAGGAGRRVKLAADAEAAVAAAPEPGELSNSEGVQSEGDQPEDPAIDSSSDGEGEGAEHANGTGAGSAGVTEAALADAKAAKAAAKAAKKAASLAEKERKRLEKQERREQRAAEKAAEVQRRAAEKAAAAEKRAAEKAAAAEQRAAEKEAARLAKEEARARRKGSAAVAATAPEASGSSGCDALGQAASGFVPEGTGKGEKVRWWQRKKSATGTEPQAAVPTATAEGGSVARGGDGSRDGSESDTEDNESGLDAEAEEAARDERMGLDEQTRRALAEFLSLPDDEVFESGGGGAAAVVAAGPSS